MKEELFLPCDMALELKKLGFNEDCLYYYDSFNYVGSSSAFWQNYNKSENLISRPLIEQAINWFISRFRLYIETPMYVIDGGEYDGCYAFKAQVKDTEDYKEKVVFEEQQFPTKLKAQIAALNHAIKFCSWAKQP